MLVPKYFLVVCLIVSFVLLCGSTRRSARSDAPCGTQNSNREMRECYTREESRINAEADELIEKIANDQLKEAKATSEAVISDSLTKAASTLRSSQQSWRTYRDQHCKAIEYLWTTGSGAGTAYEACMFEIGKARVAQLKLDFQNTGS